MTPYIIYTRERVDSAQLHISQSVYEERKERYKKRIQAMIDYVTTDTVCRSRMLLRYFGEKNEHNCGVCDTCLSRLHHEKDDTSVKDIKKRILVLTEEKPCTPADIATQLQEDKNIVTQAIRELLEEHKLKSENGLLLK